MSELADTIREALAALAAGDRSCKRFGAAAHRYALAPPIAPGNVSIALPPAAIDALAVPPDLEAFVTTVGGSGAGPGYGFLGLEHGVVTAAAPWRIGVAVAHLGCGYAAVVSLADGRVWIDARAVGVARPIAPTFTAWYLDWIDRLAHNLLPEAHVPQGICALPNALGGFLATHEARLGIEAGTLNGPALRDALGELGPHSIEIAAESSVLFATGTRVDPCVACARLVENLAADGLGADVIRPGERPHAGR